MNKQIKTLLSEDYDKIQFLSAIFFQIENIFLNHIQDNKTSCTISR